MADEKGLHVIQFTEERDHYLVVRASPSGRCKADEEIGSDQILDFHTTEKLGHKLSKGFWIVLLLFEKSKELPLKERL